MGLQLPLNAHGRRFKKADVSATTDISSGRKTPSLSQWPVVMLTPAESGVPGLRLDSNGKPIPFNNFPQAKDYFVTGDAVELARFLFNPAPLGNPDIRGPEEVYPLRVGSPTQAELTLKNEGGADDALTLTSRDYGTLVNDVEVKVEKTGDRHVLTFRYGKTVVATPSLGPQFQIIYHGAGTAATLTVTRTAGVATGLTTSITGAATDNLDITLSTFKTMEALVSYINSLDNYACVMDVDGLGGLSPSKLDAETAISLYTFSLSETPTEIFADRIEFVTDVEAGNLAKIGDYVRETPTETWKQIVNISGKFVYVNEALTPDASPAVAAAINVGVTTTAILAAIASHLNAENPYVTAVVETAGDDGTGLDEIVYTKLGTGTAGTNPAVVLQDWLDAQTVLEQKFRGRGMILFLNTSDRTIHASFAGFAQEMHDADKGIFPFFSGSARGETKTSILARGPYVNSRFAKVVGRGATIIDSFGEAQEVGAVYVAAMACGQVAGSGLSIPLTFNPIPAIALEGDYDDDDISDFIKAGIIITEEDPDKGFVFQIGVTTAQEDNRFANVIFLDHQRNTTERALRANVKKLYLGKALVKTVQGDIRTTAKQTLDGFLDTGGAQDGFLQSIGAITVEGNANGLVTITHEEEYTDEFDNGIIKGFARIATFVDIGAAATA